MRRIGRYILNGLTVLSLVLFLATIGLWVWSYVDPVVIDVGSLTLFCSRGAITITRWSSYYSGDYRPSSISLHCGVVFAAALLPMALTAARLVRRRRAQARRAAYALPCPRCGYDLRATPDRCPECGTIQTKVKA